MLYALWVSCVLSLRYILFLIIIEFFLVFPQCPQEYIHFVYNLSIKQANQMLFPSISDSVTCRILSPTRPYVCREIMPHLQVIVQQLRVKFADYASPLHNCRTIFHYFLLPGKHFSGRYCFGLRLFFFPSFLCLWMLYRDGLTDLNQIFAQGGGVEWLEPY